MSKNKHKQTTVKYDESKQLTELKEQIADHDTRIKHLKDDKLRQLTEREIELKFLIAKLQYQTNYDEKELQLLNEKIREYKEKIKTLTIQLKELRDKASTEAFKLLVINENQLKDEISKLEKEKKEKEIEKSKQKGKLKDYSRQYDICEIERVKYCEEIQKTRGQIEGLESLKSVLEVKKN